MKTNNYDFIAPWYDRLSRLVFFRSQVNAQKEQLSFIENHKSILIVGGGTGWILEEIAKLYQDLQITYVESSENMIELAKQKKYGKNTVDFVSVPIENFTDIMLFDVILTGFLFDNFKNDRAELVFLELDKKLKKKGFWLFSDFTDHHKKNHWQNLLLKLMYFFFDKVARVEAKGLVNMHPHFMEYGYQAVQKKYYYKSFIKAVVYRK